MFRQKNTTITALLSTIATIFVVGIGAWQLHENHMESQRLETGKIILAYERMILDLNDVLIDSLVHPSVGGGIDFGLAKISMPFQVEPGEATAIEVRLWQPGLDSRVLKSAQANWSQTGSVASFHFDEDFITGETGRFTMTLVRGKERGEIRFGLPHLGPFWSNHEIMGRFPEVIDALLADMKAKNAKSSSE